MSDRTRLLEAVLRQDLLAFVQRVFRDIDPGTQFVMGWHYEAIAWQLARVMRGECRRLIINVPPRSGKSVLATIAWPMFLWGHDPTLKMICVSHTEDLARDFSIKRRAIAESDWYQSLFPDTQMARLRDLELRTSRFGSCFASGVGGAILGRGADVIIVDDPLKGLDALSEASRRRVNDFFDNTLITRLNDKTRGAVVIIMQRLHEDDLVGHVLERGDWEVVSFPAIATEDTVHPLSGRRGDMHRRRAGDLLMPEREPIDVLNELRRAQGSLLFQAQYQQQPAPAGGNVIRREWLRYCDAPPETFDRLIVSWDTASTLNETSDWSVGQVWGAKGLDYYLLDVVRDRLEAPDLRRTIVDVAMRWEADTTIIEDTELGRALGQDLRRAGLLRPILIRPYHEKRVRLEAQSARFEAGQVHLPHEAPWLGEYVRELLAFPAGKHDDQVDATSQALDYLTGRNARSGPLVRRTPERRQVVERREVVRR
ncbi:MULTISPECIES: phage terminase large subunit [unclassified Phenylobacterium]|uniref:phage terminase large subunit n=1 Tax=unclassified Phenylobacterium TaxID=2640670 RepID=UPI0022B50E36|nr:phage terminase large subunit [Phenylobacterium sp. NIBR 498073]WGU42068.1 phage terminase large subunit [Phenylobacterium sp. NIBR 498073]